MPAAAIMLLSFSQERQQEKGKKERLAVEEVGRNRFLHHVVNTCRRIRQGDDDVLYVLIHNLHVALLVKVMVHIM